MMVSQNSLDDEYLDLLYEERFLYENFEKTETEIET